MRNDMDLRIAEEKVWHDIAHCELHSGHGRSATHGALRFIQPMAYAEVRFKLLDAMAQCRFWNS
jgi:hypothetical protein